MDGTHGFKPDGGALNRQDTTRRPAAGIIRGNWGLALAWLTLPLLLSGCGSARGPLVRTEVLPYTEEQAAARQEAQGARYRIRAGDMLRVAFKYDEELNQDRVVVLPDGYITLSGLDTSVPVAGLTINEVDDHLTSIFAEDMRDPVISVAVTELAALEVYVLGDVNRPGLYKVPQNGVGVLQTIALAGGFTDDAKTSQTVIMRVGEDGFYTRIIDLSNIAEAGIQDLALLDVQPYDIVYVPRSTLGDVSYLSKAVFGSLSSVTGIFWDVYAILNLDKIDRIVR